MTAQASKLSENVTPKREVGSQKDGFDIYLGRQPIYDREMNVFGYELLYREGINNYATITDGDAATSNVVVNTVMEIGLDKVVGRHHSFINLTRGFLNGKHPIPFPKERIVLEVLADAQADKRVLKGLRKLSDEGYIIALDDFTYEESSKHLVELADIVMLDVLAMDRRTLTQQVRELRNYPLRLVAKKVETQEDLEFFQTLGFDYYQGFFLSRPKVLQGRGVHSNHLAILQLLAKLQDPDVDARELEELISHDVILSYKLLRYINSAFFSLSRNIESIGQATVYLGSRLIKSWVSLIVLSGIEGKPPDLTTTALARAKMCELLAIRVHAANPESDFTVGLFSALDALMDLPMKEIVQSLPLTKEISAALLDHTGNMGDRLRCTLNYERADWGAVAAYGLQRAELTDIYLNAICWADDTSNSLRE